MIGRLLRRLWPFGYRERCQYVCPSMPFLGGTGYCKKPRGHRDACDFRAEDSDARSETSKTSP